MRLVESGIGLCVYICSKASGGASGTSSQVFIGLCQNPVPKAMAMMQVKPSLYTTLNMPRAIDALT